MLWRVMLRIRKFREDEVEEDDVWKRRWGTMMFRMMTLRRMKMRRKILQRMILTMKTLRKMCGGGGG